jgi:hypothetical protein
VAAALVALAAARDDHVMLEQPVVAATRALFSR